MNDRHIESMLDDYGAREAAQPLPPPNAFLEEVARRRAPSRWTGLALAAGLTLVASAAMLLFQPTPGPIEVASTDNRQTILNLTAAGVEGLSRWDSRSHLDNKPLRMGAPIDPAAIEAWVAGS